MAPIEKLSAESSAANLMERLLEFAAKNKFFRASDAEAQAQVSRVYLQSLVESVKLVRTARGLYSLAGGAFTETRDVLEASSCKRSISLLLSQLPQ